MSTGIAVLLFVDMGPDRTVAEPDGIVRPSEQFAEIVSRGWPKTPILGAPLHVSNSEQWEQWGNHTDLEDETISSNMTYSLWSYGYIDSEDDAKRPPSLEPQGQEPGWLESEKRFAP